MVEEREGRNRVEEELGVKKLKAKNPASLVCFGKALLSFSASHLLNYRRLLQVTLPRKEDTKVCLDVARPVTRCSFFAEIDP